MNSIKQNKLAFFKKRKLNVFILFVILALVFSILTKLSTDYTQTLAFDIETFNVPDDKVIIKDSTHQLNITLTTYGFKLIYYQLTHPSVKINMDELDQDDMHFVWTEKKEFANIISQFDANVKIENIIPDTLRLRFDSQGVKKVPVVLNSDIQFAPGYDLLNTYQIEPDSVNVIGPKILVDSIQFAETEVLNQVDINTNISSRVKLQLPENDQLRYSQSDVLIEGEVDRFTEGSINVPVIVRNIPENINLKIYPKSIEVVFYASLKEIKSIGSSSFIVECDYNETLNEASSFLTPIIIQQPDYVKNARLNIKRIEYFITK